VPIPGDVVTIYYDSFRLGAPFGIPVATFGYFDGADFVEVQAAAPMIELESPAATPTAIFSAQFVIPTPPDAFGTWLGIVKANVESVDRHFAFPFEVTKNSGQHPFSEFAGGGDLSLFGPWLAQNLRAIRRVTDRLIISQAVLEQFNRDRIIALISGASAKTGEDAVFTFSIIDVETGKPLNIEGAIVRFIGEEEITAVPAWDIAGSIVDGTQGRAEALLNSALTATLLGRYASEVKVTLPDLTIKITQTFTITVDPSLSPP
jgi:hypothetical protein